MLCLIGKMDFEKFMNLISNIYGFIVVKVDLFNILDCFFFFFIDIKWELRFNEYCEE